MIEATAAAADLRIIGITAVLKSVVFWIEMDAACLKENKEANLEWARLTVLALGLMAIKEAEIELHTNHQLTVIAATGLTLIRDVPATKEAEIKLHRNHHQHTVIATTGLTLIPKQELIRLYMCMYLYLRSIGIHCPWKKRCLCCFQTK
jgi:hypothetical protein